MRFTGTFKLAAVIVVVAAAVIAVVVATASGGSSSSKTAGRQSAPAQAPGFTVAALGSSTKKITLDSQYAGKPVIVNFWASWCAPCQKETPLLARWYSQHRTVNLIGLDENDSATAAEKFAKAKGVTYPLGFDPQVKVALAYGVQAGIPQTFFLNARHQIVDRVYGAVTTADLNRGLRLMR